MAASEGGKLARRPHRPTPFPIENGQAGQRPLGKGHRAFIITGTNGQAGSPGSARGHHQRVVSGAAAKNADL